MVNLNQQEAIDSLQGYVRVLAGAGSGKTLTLTERYIKLIELGIMPENILCVTFTTKAANSMRAKIQKRTGNKDLGYINTFHGFCHKVLTYKDTYKDHQINAGSLKLPIDYKIADSDEQTAAIKEAIKRLGHTTDEIDVKQIQKYIHKTKDLGLYDSYARAMTAGTSKVMERNLDLTESVYWMYMNIMREKNQLDFDDLVYLTILLFHYNPLALEFWQNRLQYIMVDEFQDIDAKQYILIDQLSQKNKNLFVVGDSNQTIYSFRGSHVEYFLGFGLDHIPCHDVRLPINYRSTPQILKAANKLIGWNTSNNGLVLEAVNSEGKKPLYYHAKTEDKMIKWVADVIADIKDRGAKYSDIAILYRSNSLGESLNNKLAEHNIPSVLRAGTSFYKRKEVLDAIAYLRLIYDISDNSSFDRICNKPTRGLGAQSVKKIIAAAEQEQISHFEALEKLLADGSLKNDKAKDFTTLIRNYEKKAGKENISTLFKRLLSDSKYYDTTANILSVEESGRLGALISSSHAWASRADDETDLLEYLNEIALYTDKSDDTDMVSLMTVHASKGLEFPYVIIYELSEPIFPSSSTKTDEGMEEERRLAYVALTRAEKELYLCDSEGLTYGRGYRSPSRFIFELEDTIDYVEELDEELVCKSKKNILQADTIRHNLTTLTPGMTVNHKLYGEGEIVSIDSEHIEIDFKSQGLIKLTLIAPLEIVDDDSLDPIDIWLNDEEENKRVEQAIAEAMTHEPIVLG